MLNDTSRPIVEIRSTNLQNEYQVNSDRKPDRI